MPAIKDTASIAKKYGEVTPARAAQYEEGVRNPLKSWLKETMAAKENFKAGITAAIAADAFGKGVAEAGDETWQQGATQKGPGRFAQGTALAAPDYEEGFAPFRDVIAKTVLPPRGPKGSPQNLQRVAAMANALHTAAKR